MRRITTNWLSVVSGAVGTINKLGFDTRTQQFQPLTEHPSRLHSTTTNVSDRWVYSEVANVAEAGYGAHQIGPRESAIAVGLRDHVK